MRFNLGNMVRAISAGTWDAAASYERGVAEGLQSEHGGGRSGFYRIPDDALSLRDLTVASASGGGYLAQTQLAGYIPSVVPFSVALRAGAVVDTLAAPGQALYPKGTANVSTTWLSTEASSITESQPTFGQAAAVPKLLSVFTEVSRQLLLQSNADAILRLELLRAAGAALDAAVLAGTGASGQPTGIVSTAGVGGFTGASLSQAQIRNAQADVCAAVQVPGNVSFVTTPAVAEILSTRQRFTGSDRALWEGPLPIGAVEGSTSYATASSPSATAIVGDFSAVTIVQWTNGAQIMVDPFTKFTSAVVGVRLLLPVDVVVRYAAAFSIATGVT